MKKYRGYLLVLLIAFCIQGCSKQQDVEDHRFVLAMGFAIKNSITSKWNNGILEGTQGTE